jgi:hypothetical protein
VKGSRLLMSLVVFLGMPCVAMVSQRDRVLERRDPIVIKTDTGFFVNDRGVINAVKHYDVDPFLRKLSPIQLQRFGELGNRIKTTRLSNGDYMLRAKGDLNGGGGLLAALAVTATVVGGGIVTLGATAGTLVTAGPIAAGAVAIAGTKATCAAAVYVGIAATVTPTP